MINYVIVSFYPLVTIILEAASHMFHGILQNSVLVSRTNISL